LKIKWSHSSLKDFEGCARRYHEVKILKKYPFQETEQIKYGKELHKAAEDYVRDGTPIPEQFKFMVPIMEALMRKNGRKFPEHEMALTESLRPCDFNAEDMWVRGIADLLIIDGDHAFIIDYKTGGTKYPDPKQLRLMSLMTFAHYPEIKKVKAGLLFVAHNYFIPEEYKREDMDKSWGLFTGVLSRLDNSFDTNTWQPNPTPLCKFCPVKSCEFNNR